MQLLDTIHIFSTFFYERTAFLVQMYNPIVLCIQLMDKYENIASIYYISRSINSTNFSSGIEYNKELN